MLKIHFQGLWIEEVASGCDEADNEDGADNGESMYK